MVDARFEASTTFDTPSLEPLLVNALDATTLAHLQSWQGRTEIRHDIISVAPVRAMSALLDRTDAEPRLGDVLPALWHWLYFWPTTAQSELGEDGHPKRGSFLPPVPFPRRMWAGGRLQWHQPMRLGDPIQRTSRIDQVQHKTGRSGELLFVQVQHSYRGPQGLCLEETHDIVYKPLALGHEPMGAGISPSLTAEWQRELVPDDVLLFRYSALTFNSHRIHYDRRYAMHTEGYPGLVVHGPLMASLLIDLLRRHSDRMLSTFAFKALKPVFECADQRSLRLCAATPAEEVHAWVQDHEGHVCMQAVAHWSTQAATP